MRGPRMSQNRSRIKFEYERTNAFRTICKDLLSGKKLVLDLSSKKLQTNQNTDFSILQYEVNFLFAVTIHGSNKFSTSFQVGVLKHAQTSPKLSQIVSQFHPKNELSYKVSLWHVVRGSKKSKICSAISSGCRQAWSE